jgi:hypothetical protein
MVLLVARCLAVYGATAAAILFLVRRYVSPLPLRVALGLAAAPLLFTGRALLTGDVYGPIDILYNGYPFGAHRVELGVGPDRTPVLSDIVYQQIPWRSAVRRALSEGRLPLWNPDVLGGEPLLAVQQPAALHPGTWIGLLLPLPQAWTFEMTLRLLIALLCAYLFLRDLWCCELASLLGALGWAFSNWMIFSLGVPLMPAAAPFPLLLLGLRRIVREPGRRSVALTVVALVLIGVAGHPETLLHACAAGGVYFLFELGSDSRRTGVRPPAGVRPFRLRSVSLALGAAALALGLLAVQLLPLAEALPHTMEHSLRRHWYSQQTRSVPVGENLRRLTPQVMPYAVGVSGQGRLREGFLEPSAYGGALLLPLAFAGLFARRRERWIFVALGLLGLAVGIKTPVADALAKLPLFDIALNERLLFLTVFSLCVLAALGAHRLREGEGAPAFFAGAGTTLLLLGVLYTRVKPRVLALGMPPAYLTERFLLQTVPVLLAIAVLAVLSRRRRATAGLAALVVILAASRVLEVGPTHPVMPLSTFYPPMSVLAKIPRGEPWRIAGVGDRALIPNASAVYGLEDVRGYAAMTLLRLYDTFPLWCEAQPVWFNRIDDPTRPFLSFLNVRWVLTEPSVRPPAGWPVLAEADGLRLLENPAALPRVFVPRTVRVERDPARRRELLNAIDDFAERGVVESDGPLGEWIGNGPARLEIAAYRADALDVDVEASARTLVATSVAAWPGWKAHLDGVALSALPYNHAFLAFRVPAGRHRLSLRYFPDAVARGIAVSAATLLLCVILLFRPAGRELRQNPV